MGHLQDNGYEVTAIDVTGAELSQIKAEHGVPGPLYGCHTGIIDDYVLEGHVPADVVARLLKERPSVTGLSVPGMPMGAPGMEGPNPQPYTVFTFNESGEREVYERR